MQERCVNTANGLLFPLHWGHQVHKHHFSCYHSINQVNFAWQRIQEELVSDNVPQFSAEEFNKFAKKYGFHHKPSSPKFPQTNGEAEGAVKTIKTTCIWNKSSDLSLELLANRATPRENRYSPAELLMGRIICTTVPIISKEPSTCLPDHSKLQKKEWEMRDRLKKSFDSHYKARYLKPLDSGVCVWLPDIRGSGAGGTGGATAPPNISVGEQRSPNFAQALFCIYRTAKKYY